MIKLEKIKQKKLWLNDEIKSQKIFNIRAKGKN